MIGGILILLAAVWIYRAAIRAKKGNAFMWVAIGAGVFFAVQLLLVDLNIYLLETIKFWGTEGVPEVELGADRVRQTSQGPFVAFLVAVYMELAPPLAGFIAVAFLRTMVILKEKPTLHNLFSDIKEIFSGFKKVFTKPEN